MNGESESNFVMPGNGDPTRLIRFRVLAGCIRELHASEPISRYKSVADWTGWRQTLSLVICHFSSEEDNVGFLVRS